MTDTSPRWALPMLYAGQAHKELFHNEALARIDMLLHGAALSADFAVPPSTPAVGDCWIVAVDGQGAWAGQDSTIACWTEGGWRFVTPQAGTRLYVIDRGHAVIHDGVNWTDDPVRGDGVYIGAERVVGARQPAISLSSGGATIDVEARDAIAAILDRLEIHGLIGM